MRTSTKKITAYTTLNTEVEVEIDVDINIIEDYIDKSNPDELKRIFEQVTAKLKDEDVAGHTTLIYHNPNIMEQLAMQELQEVLRFKGPEFIRDAIHYFNRK